MTHAKQLGWAMSDKQKKHVYKALPKRGPSLHTLLWVMIGFSQLIILGSAWVLLLLGGSVGSHHNFVGQLSPASDPIVVTLPQGAIAHFTDLPKNAQDQARLARQDCEVFLEEKNLIQKRLEEDRHLLTQERDLIDDYIAVLNIGMQGDLPPHTREENARQILALAILRNKLDRQIADAQFGASKDDAEWQKRRLERVRKLVEKIRYNTNLRHHMHALLEQPRLQAPENGFVVQVRKIQRDAVMKENVDLLVLRPEEGAGYQANFEVPHYKLDAVAAGDRVQLKMLGMLDWGPVLRGRVSSLQSTGRTSVRATITLDSESITQLDDPQIGIALRGLGTASIIRVQKEGLESLPVLEKIISKGLLQPGNDWFVTRFFSPETESERPVEIRG